MITQITPNIWQMHFKEFSSCVYLIKLNEKNILIDTGTQEIKKELIENLKELNSSEIDIIILTHDHWDHVGNIKLFPNAKIYDSKNICKLKIPEFKILSTPGHSKTDICILYENVLFSGDVIFHNGFIGRTDFPKSSHEKMIDSLNRLKKINYKILCPGHI